MSKIKKVKVVRKLDFDESVKTMADRQVAFMHGVEAKLKEVIDRHNNLAAEIKAIQNLVQRVVSSVVHEVGQLRAHVTAVATESDRALVGMDRNILALSEISKKICGNLVQVDIYLQRLGAKAEVLLDLNDDEVDDARKSAETWFQEATTSAFEIVQQRMQDVERERMAQMVAEQTATDEAQKAALDMEERERIESELKKAEADDRSLVVPAGGPGSGIPEGANVFGGDYAAGGQR